MYFTIYMIFVVLSNYSASAFWTCDKCEVDKHCPGNKACVNYQCRDPCTGACGTGSACTVFSHKPQCTCPENYYGDPKYECIRKGKCHRNKHCPENKACINNQCKDPCTGACGSGAVCTVFKHIPQCTCPENYFGDPTYECIRKGKCHRNKHCPENKACINNQCKDPCTGACGSGAVCTVFKHIPQCTCPENYFGDPKYECIRKGECHRNEHCPENKACINNQCKDPCTGACGSGAVCTVFKHIPQCTCPENYFGDPKYECIRKGECHRNEHCPDNKACINNQCKDPCTGACGSGAVCTVFRHKPQCTCPENFFGDSKYECFRIGDCLYDKHCAENKLACINNQCKDPCIGACGSGAVCTVFRRKPQCTCPENYYGDPKYECIREGECRHNKHCPQNEACINDHCQDPCTGACGTGALCTVFTHKPQCTFPKNKEGDSEIECVEKSSFNYMLLTAVVAGILVFVVMIIGFTMCFCRSRRHSPPTAVAKSTNSSHQPFYLNILFRSQCQREMDAWDAGYTEITDPPIPLNHYSIVAKSTSSSVKPFYSNLHLKVQCQRESDVCDAVYEEIRDPPITLNRNTAVAKSTSSSVKPFYHNLPFRDQCQRERGHAWDAVYEEIKSLPAPSQAVPRK